MILNLLRFYREEERELERRIAQVAIGQTITPSVAEPEEGRITNDEIPQRHAADIERKKKLVKAIEAAEMRFTSKNFKVFDKNC